jgi:Na+-driven multidrug efflux pump
VAIGTVQVNLTVVFVTAAVGRLGPDAIAGYGIASRLDYIQIPIIFGLGTALVTMVGVNIGAGQTERARRIAWIGAALAFGVTALIGLAAAIFPHAWIGLFSDDPQVLAMGALYLRYVAPAYGAVGLGLALYFASQGANRVPFPVLAGTVRMIIAAFFGWIAVSRFGAGLSTLFQIVALAAVAYGSLTAAAVLGRPRARSTAGSAATRAWPNSPASTRRRSGKSPLVSRAAWRSRSDARDGWSRRSRRGVAWQGSARRGKAVKAGPGWVRPGLARRVGRG